MTPVTQPPRISLLPAPSRPGHAYVVRAPGERLCVEPAPTLAPRAGEWYTRATWPGSTAAWEAASALPDAAACALAAALTPPPPPRKGRPPLPASTPDAASIEAALAAGGYPSREAMAVDVVRRCEGYTTAAAVVRAMTRARSGSPLGEDMRGALEWIAGGPERERLRNKAI